MGANDDKTIVNPIQNAAAQQQGNSDSDSADNHENDNGAPKKSGLGLACFDQLPKYGVVGRALLWYLTWAIPGMGMFSEAYIIFSAGQIGIFQQTMWPSCYVSFTTCDADMVKHLASYIQICGIMAGMLLWGVLGDFTGRKWGSRFVALIMLTGCVMLTFTPWAPGPYDYFVYFMVSQTWYGFGVGGEYPMASSSAAERSATTPELRATRGRQVVLVFSNQGMGNFINAVVILISMAIFGQTGTSKQLTFEGSKNVLALTYGFGAIACIIMVLYRWIFLEESKLYKEATTVEHKINEQKLHVPEWKLALHRHKVSLYYYWPRQLVASGAWIANDFAFYGSKLQQSLFIGLLYPGATPYKKQQWTVLNNFIALTGYYMAAWLVDKRWYGRRLMQNVGFIAIAVFYFIIYGQWNNMAVTGSSQAGQHAFQALYYLASFFNQFGPNATTWLVAGEIFPTDIRSTYHGFAACMGKLGAIIAALWISFIADKRKVFLVSAVWGVGGAIITWLLLPDTTGLELEEYDRLQRYIMEGRFKEYCGEAVNPKHLSYFERFVLRWGKQYNPELDKQKFAEEVAALSNIPEAVEEMHRMSVVTEEEFKRASLAAAKQV